MVVAPPSPAAGADHRSSSILSAIRTVLLTLLTTLQSTFDTLLPPARRTSLKAYFSNFSTHHPFLATLLLCQLIFCGIPCLLFALFTASVFLFALATALIAGVLCALAFTGVCMGLAALVLLPVLLVTMVMGVGVWCWGLGIWLVLRWLGWLGGQTGEGEGEDTEAEGWSREFKEEGDQPMTTAVSMNNSKLG